MKALPIQFDESITAWEKAIDAFLAEKACRSGSIDIPFDVAISPDQVQRARNSLNLLAVFGRRNCIRNRSTPKTILAAADMNRRSHTS